MHKVSLCGSGVVALILSGCALNVQHRVDLLTNEVLSPAAEQASSPATRSLNFDPAGKVAPATSESCDKVSEGDSVVPNLSDLTFAERIYVGQLASRVSSGKAPIAFDRLPSGKRKELVVQMVQERRDDPDGYLNTVFGPELSGAVVEDGHSSRALPRSLVLLGRYLLGAKDPCIAKKRPLRIQPFDLKSLASTAHGIALHSISTTADPIGESSRDADVLRTVSAGAPAPGGHEANPISTPGYALLMYEVEYYKGTFTDHFGNTLTAPKQGDTVSDTTLSGVTQVLVEWFADLLLKTPLYYSLGAKDAAGNQAATFYPSGANATFSSTTSVFTPTKSPAGGAAAPAASNTASKKLPTSLRWIYVPTEVLDANASACNPPSGTKLDVMTKKKLSVVGYGAQTIGSAVAHWTGGIYNTLGGADVSAVVLGAKFSIGDNKTLDIIVKTAVETATRRIAEYELVKAISTSDTALTGELGNVFFDADCP